MHKCSVCAYCMRMFQCDCVFGWVSEFNSPRTHRGLRANFSRPLQPLYRQQQPAAHILNPNSPPKIKIVNVSYRWEKHSVTFFNHPVSHRNTALARNRRHTLTRITSQCAESFSCSLNVVKIDRIRHPKTIRNLEIQKTESERELHTIERERERERDIDR